MFKPNIGICRSCERKRLIVVKKGLCQVCNYNLKVMNPKIKPTKKLKGTEKKQVFGSLKKKFKKPTGELLSFKKLWEERPHRSELSGKAINEFDIFCWHHILGKKAYPKFRLVKKNIILVTRQEHIDIHNGTLRKELNDVIKDKAEILKILYYSEEIL